MDVVEVLRHPEVDDYDMASCSEAIDRGVFLRVFSIVFLWGWMVLRCWCLHFLRGFILIPGFYLFFLGGEEWIVRFGLDKETHRHLVRAWYKCLSRGPEADAVFVTAGNSQGDLFIGWLMLSATRFDFQRNRTWTKNWVQWKRVGIKQWLWTN